MASMIDASSPLKFLGGLPQLPLVRQLGFMVLTAAGIALGLAVVLWARTPAYTALYLDMSTQDSNEVISLLDQQGVDYRIAAGGLVTVPADQVRQLRLQLANAGLPRSTVQGYDILDQEQALGTSNFIEEARYNRALEQELVRTIKHIRGVREARVHLSIPKQSSFIRNNRKPSASVMLDLAGVQELSDMQLAGIVHLLSSSVAGMEPEDVSIIDARGNLLSTRADSSLGQSAEHLRLARRIEQDYMERIVNILTPIVGEGKVRAQVAADIDYSIVETTQENFDPATQILRSEQTQQESVAGAVQTEPGAVSPLPPVEGESPLEASADNTVQNSSRSRVNATRNYEIDRSVSHIRSMPGSIERLTVAVLVDLTPPAPARIEGQDDAAPPPVAPAEEAARLARITQLVKDSIGFSEARGDSVNVVNETFSPLPMLAEPEALPIWEQDWVVPLAKQVSAGLVVLLLIFAVFRPALRTIVAQPALPAGSRGVEVLPAADMDLEEDQVTLSSAPKKIPAKSAFDENLGLAQSLVEKEPVRAARMIKEWVNND